MVYKHYKEVTDADGNLDIVSDTNLPLPSEIRNRWCFGLPLNKEDGSVMSDEDILTYLKAAVSRVERELGVFLKPTTIRTHPEEKGLVEGVDYDLEQPPYDYDARAYRQYGFLQLRHRHIQQLLGLKLVLPNGIEIVNFMRDENTTKWIKLYKESGQLHIVPYAGDPTLFAILGGTSSGYPFVTGAIHSNLPQMIYADYITGYKLHQIPDEVRNIVAKIAAVDVLGIAGDAVLAGVASLSTGIDGLSESFSTTASATSATYGAHIKQYQDEISHYFDPKKGMARSSERGITMTGL